MTTSGPLPLPAAQLFEAASTLHLRVGALDNASTTMLRSVLSKARKHGVHVVVDLRQTDDAHDLTLFVLLAAAGRPDPASGVLTAVSPSLQLAHLLRAVGVTVTHDCPTLPEAADLESLSVGSLSNLEPARESRPQYGKREVGAVGA